MYVDTHTDTHTYDIYVYVYIHTNIHVFVHVHMCVHKYIHTCRHIHIHTYIHTYMFSYVHTYVCMYVHTCVYIHTYKHICVYIHPYIHTYIYVCIHTYMHTCTHIHTYIHYPKASSLSLSHKSNQKGGNLTEGGAEGAGDEKVVVAADSIAATQVPERAALYVLFFFLMHACVCERKGRCCSRFNCCNTGCTKGPFSFFNFDVCARKMVANAADSIAVVFLA